MNKLLVMLSLVLAAGGTHAQIVTNQFPGHVVYGKHGGYTCEPAGATCEVPRAREYSWSSRIVDPKKIVYTVNMKQSWTCSVRDADASSFALRCAKPMKEADWPKVVSAHIVLDSVQAKTPGNEHVKQCGQTKPNETCFDPTLRHIINHLYGTNKERCERDEGVPCQELEPCYVAPSEEHEMCRQWVPIGKPVFEDKTPEPETKPLAVSRDEWFTTESLIVENHHGCVDSFTWDEGKQACSMTIMFGGLGAVTCDPLTDGPDPKFQTMVCSYKPEAAADKK